MYEKVLLKAVLCFLVRDSQVLLAYKAKNIGVGYRNGYGGGIEDGETPEEAVVREVFEESRVHVQKNSLEKVAIMNFCNMKIDGSQFICEVHVYLARKWDGEPVSTMEMFSPEWFGFDSLPFYEMMPADKSWLPAVLAGKKIKGTAKYSSCQKELLGEVVCSEVCDLSD